MDRLPRETTQAIETGLPNAPSKRPREFRAPLTHQQSRLNVSALAAFSKSSVAKATRQSVKRVAFDVFSNAIRLTKVEPAAVL